MPPITSMGSTLRRNHLLPHPSSITLDTISIKGIQTVKVKDLKNMQCMFVGNARVTWFC